jgi:hypothetical protein
VVKISLVLILLSLVVATGASAEHKLLVTAVPDPGQIEARVDVAYSFVHGRKGQEFDGNTGALIEDSDKITHEQTRSVASFGIGVIRGVKLSIALPYTFAEHISEGWETENRDGFGDVVLGARFAPSKIITLPVDTAIGIDWKTTSADQGSGDMGTGRNSYAPYLAVSKKLYLVTPYMKYQPEFIVKNHNGQTNHSLSIGAEIEVDHRNSLDLAITGTVNGRSDGMKSSNDVELEVAPYLNITGNLYLLPRFAYTILGDRNREPGIPINWDAHQYTFGLGVYCLF